jgi:hypothetical protein
MKKSGTSFGKVCRVRGPNFGSANLLIGEIPPVESLANREIGVPKASLLAHPRIGSGWRHRISGIMGSLFRVKCSKLRPTRRPAWKTPRRRLRPVARSPGRLASGRLLQLMKRRNSVFRGQVGKSRHFREGLHGLQPQHRRPPILQSRGAFRVARPTICDSAASPRPEACNRGSAGLVPAFAAGAKSPYSSANAFASTEADAIQPIRSPSSPHPGGARRRKRLLQRPDRRPPVRAPVPGLRLIHDRQLRLAEFLPRHLQPLVQLRMLLLPPGERRAPDPEGQRRRRIRHPAMLDHLPKPRHRLLRIPRRPPHAPRGDRGDLIGGNRGGKIGGGRCGNIGGSSSGRSKRSHARDCSMPLSHSVSKASHKQGQLLALRDLQLAFWRIYRSFQPLEAPRTRLGERRHGVSGPKPFASCLLRSDSGSGAGTAPENTGWSMEASGRVRNGRPIRRSTRRRPRLLRREREREAFLEHSRANVPLALEGVTRGLTPATRAAGGKSLAWQMQTRLPTDPPALRLLLLDVR